MDEAEGRRRIYQLQSPGGSCDTVVVFDSVADRGNLRRNGSGDCRFSGRHFGFNRHRFYRRLDWYVAVVKTAGMPENSKAHLSHEQRVALLRNAVSFRQHVNHHSLPKWLNVIEGPHGPMLVYEWVTGELLGVERSRRADPASPFQRFRALPFSDLLTGLDVVFDYHRSAAELG